MTIKLHKPVGVLIKKRNGSLRHFVHFDPETEKRPESNDDFEVELVFTESQLKQAINDAIENAAQCCISLQDCGPDNGCCPTYWNEALEKAEIEIRKLKDQL